MRFRESLSLGNDKLFWLALALAVVPLWLTPYLPLVDLPQHAAQAASLREIWQENPAFTAVFEVNWFTPYLLGYLFLYAVSAVVPMVVATKIVVSFAVILFPLVIGVLLRESGADERLKWLAIPGSYSFAFYWGFMTYILAVPVALAFLVLTIRFERNPRIANGIGVAAFSIALFFCHIMALGFASLLALTYLFARNIRRPRRFVLCALPYTAPLPLIGLWMTQIYTTEASVQSSPIIFATIRERLITLFTQLSGLDGYAFAISLIIVAALLGGPPLLRYRFSPRPERWLPLVVGVAVFFTFPRFAQSTAFLYERLAVFSGTPFG